MIVKPFELTPIRIGIQALLNRLPQNSPYLQRLQKELANFEAGDQGEKYVLDLLKKLNFPFETKIFHNVIFKGLVVVQIDIFIITSHYALILEVKNIKDEIYFTKDPYQMIRIQVDGTTDKYTSPEIQLEQSIAEFTDLLMKYKLTIPIYGVIVFAYNNAIIKSPLEKFPVIFSNELPNFIRKLPINSQKLPVNKISEIVLKHHTNKNPFPLCQYYGIDPSHLINGVFCPTCLTPHMTKLASKWHCQKCGEKSTQAHLHALKEYTMLISKNMNNQQCRDFLKLRNRHEARRILKNNSVSRVGKGMATIYSLK